MNLKHLSSDGLFRCRLGFWGFSLLDVPHGRVEFFHELVEAVVSVVQVGAKLDHDVRCLDGFLNLAVIQASEP